MALLQFYGKDIHSGNKTTIVRWRLSACTIMWLFILAFLSHPVLAEDARVYGPVQFTRSTGKPERIQQTVAVTNPAASYLLRIVNGGQQVTAQTGKVVSSGTVYWNGSWIAGPSNFNQKITTLTVPVIARASNTLTVELQGKPGSSITVQLLRGNQAPTAHAGNDQTLYVGDAAKLDGSASTDGNGDALSYRWRITEKPANSLSQLSDSTAMRPEWPIDVYGHYQAELIVNDGFVDSVPDTVAIDTRNSAPVANAGADQRAFVGTTVVFNGGLSHDVDGNTLSYRWSLVENPSDSSAALVDDRLQQCRIAIDKPGHYVAQLIVNDGELDSEADLVSIDTDNSKPAANAGPDQADKTVGIPVELDGSLSTDVDGDALTYIWSLLHQPAGSSAVIQQADQVKAALTPDKTGDYVGQLIVNDGQAASDPATSLVTVSVDLPLNYPPKITTSPALTATVGSLYRYDVNAADPDNDTLTYSLSVYPAGMTINAQSGLIDWTPAAGQTGAQAVNVTVSDGKGGSDSQSFTVTPTAAAIVVLPPDPAGIAPPNDPTVATTVLASFEFLYTGSNPVQTGVTPSTIAAKRAAVIRGKVLDKQNNPLPGVTVTIKSHPEFGQTLSRADGMFDMAVNGGGLLTVNYSKTGYLNVQRQVNPGWQDYQSTDEVVLSAKDTTVTTVDLTSATPMQIAQGSSQTDANGTRQATVLIPQGTQAQIFQPDGTTVPVTSLNLRFTEYTVGDNGPKTMPGPLPPTSGYTYAVEIGADEANVSVAGKEVQFSQPVSFYVDNFLGFPVGIQVPVGYYDKDKSAWIPSKDGRIIKIVGTTGGAADLDTNGDNIADNDPALGITLAERSQLAATYRVGKSLQRVAIEHFSTYDLNYGTSPAPGSTPPKLEQPKSDKLDAPCLASGSIIECENQTLGEKLDITGTPFSLNYRSDRVLGRKGSNTIQIQLSGATVLSTLQRVDLIVSIAGRVFTQSFPATPNQNYTFIWDGLDIYGRKVSGEQFAHVSVGYVYPAFYNMSPALSASFGAASGQRIPGNVPARQPTILWQVFSSSIGSEDARKFAQAGWSVSAHHHYDPVGRILYQGNGEQRSAQGMIANNIITTVVGNGLYGFNGDGMPATQAALKGADGIAVAADGSLYIADNGNHRIRRVGPDGIITTVAGNGTRGYSGDGVLATQTSLNSPSSIEVAADGSLYIADNDNHRIRRVGPDGIITTVAGIGTLGYSGDGGLAAQAKLAYPTDIEVAADGSLYIADSDNNRIRRVSPDGIITTVAGNGARGFNGDGGPATQASLYYPRNVKIAANGSLYICDVSNARIRRVSPDGIISTVAGNGMWGFNGDGIEAIQASLTRPWSVTIGNDGSLFISALDDHRIRRVGGDGIITTVAGNGTTGFNGDGGLVTQGSLYYPQGIALDGDGVLYINESGSDRIRRIFSALPGSNLREFIIPSKEGTELYRFDSTGRHLTTLNALTGVMLLSFGYDTQGHLSQITDGDGLITRIERDALGNPTAIVAPFGQRTTLSLDANGYLAKVTNPAGESHEMTYTADGLLTSFKDPSGHASTFTYDALGRLLTDSNAGGGGLSLSRTELADGHIATVTSALNRVTTHTVRNLTTGDRVRKHTQPDTTTSTTLEKTDGTTVITEADGTLATLLKGPDPRFSMLSPIAKSLQISTGGLSANLTGQRTAVLADPNNPLSLTTLTDSVTVNGRTQTTVYDAVSKTFIATSAAARQSKAVIDNLGRITQTQATGLLAVNSTYDPQGRLSTLAQGSGADERLISVAYNPQGYLDSITDPVGRQVKYQYDLTGRVTKQTLPDNREIVFSYDANGNLTSLLPPGRPGHSFTYTPVNLTESTVPPDVAAGTNSTLYRYNLDKQLTQVQRPDGQSIDYSYDSAGRTGSITVPEGNYSYSYNPTTGKLAGITTPDGLGLNVTFSGALPTQTDWTGIVTGSVDKTYDNDFRVSTVSVNGANPFSYQYDNDSLLTVVNNATLGINFTLTRDAQNGLLTGTVLGSLTDSYSYNGFGEVSQYAAKYAASELYKTDFSRDKLGRITQKVETTGGSSNTYDYAYDVAGRLAEVKQNGTVQSRYGYDSNGNRTDLNGVPIAHYDAQDRLLDYNNATYDYTANGELKTRTVGTAMTSYSYDVLGNLRHVNLPNGSAIDYVIDGQNRRIGKKRNNMLEQGFLYQDSIKPIAELDGNNQIVSRFVYATGTNVPDFMIKGGATYRIIKDHLGSPRLVVDIATNTVIQSMNYDVWGKAIQDSNPGFQPFGYAGGLYDRDTGLVRFGARDYDTETGRWTVKDPIGFAGGDSNLYGYVTDDPVNWFDQEGLCDCRGILNDALKLNNDSGYGFKGTYGPGTSTNKCNTFVNDALKNTDVQPRRYSGLGGPISAGTWADPEVYIPHFSVTSNPQPGDIVAIAHDYGFASGHVAIVLEPGKTSIGAGAEGSHITGWPWDPKTSPQGTPVYRHCSCTRIGQ